jgi:hypothetical protein
VAFAHSLFVVDCLNVRLKNVHSDGIANKELPNLDMMFSAYDLLGKRDTIFDDPRLPWCLLCHLTEYTNVSPLTLSKRY